jgi:hypothetical protein
MNLIGLITILLFLVGWLCGVVTWFYGVSHMRKWKRLRRLGTGTAPAHLRKTLWATVVFAGCVAFVFIDGLIGSHWGN